MIHQRQTVAKDKKHINIPRVCKKLFRPNMRQSLFVVHTLVGYRLAAKQAKSLDLKTSRRENFTHPIPSFYGRHLEKVDNGCVGIYTN